MKARIGGTALIGAMSLGGCSDIQSAIAPFGTDASRIADLAWLLFIGAAVVFAIMGGALTLAVVGPARLRKALSSDAAIAVGGIAFPVVTLALLLTYGVWLMRDSINSSDPALHVEVQGERWWWRVTYVSSKGIRIDGANEIRIPVGREVEFVLTSADVIHSFWVPSLGGKVDMIPGRTTRLRLTAERPGIYRGQCAEYCGGPHALMALEVRAMPPDEFDSWLGAVQTTVAPMDEIEGRGGSLFVSMGCGACHRIAGTAAQGTVGPDLTHVGSRRFIAAATLPTTPPNIARFITDGQHVKPGNLMPPFKIFSPEEIGAVAAYLASLK